MSQLRVKYIGPACSLRFMGKKFKPHEVVTFDSIADKVVLDALQYEKDFEIWPVEGAIVQSQEPTPPAQEIIEVDPEQDSMPPADLLEVVDDMVVEVASLDDDARLPVIAKKGKSKR